MRRSDELLNKIYIQTFYNISLSSIMRWYRGHIEGRFRNCRVKGYQPRIVRCLPFSPNRRDHKSYDRQGTTHSRHFTFHPIFAEQKTYRFLWLSPWLFSMRVELWNTHFSFVM